MMRGICWVTRNCATLKHDTVRDHAHLLVLGQVLHEVPVGHVCQALLDGGHPTPMPRRTSAKARSLPVEKKAMPSWEHLSLSL